MFLRFHRWCFLSSEKELFSSTYILKKTPRMAKILISPVWKKILKIWDTLFELIQIEVKCTKNYFKVSLSQEAGAWKYHRKRAAKITSKITWKNYKYQILTENIWSACNPMQAVFFCKGSIIPLVVIKAIAIDCMWFLSVFLLFALFPLVCVQLGICNTCLVFVILAFLASQYFVSHSSSSCWLIDVIAVNYYLNWYV